MINNHCNLQVDILINAFAPYPKLKAIYYKLEMHLSLNDKQMVTAVACCEKMAKLIPLSTSETPKGNAWPGTIFNIGPVSKFSGASC